MISWARANRWLSSFARRSLLRSSVTASESDDGSAPASTFAAEAGGLAASVAADAPVEEEEGSGSLPLCCGCRAAGAAAAEDRGDVAPLGSADCSSTPVAFCSASNFSFSTRLSLSASALSSDLRATSSSSCRCLDKSFMRSVEGGAATAAAAGGTRSAEDGLCSAGEAAPPVPLFFFASCWRASSFAARTRKSIACCDTTPEWLPCELEEGKEPPERSEPSALRPCFRRASRTCSSIWRRFSKRAASSSGTAADLPAAGRDIFYLTSSASVSSVKEENEK